eukprot:6554356-Lingulodinium_polyedra.AAC.1
MGSDRRAPSRAARRWALRGGRHRGGRDRSGRACPDSWPGDRLGAPHGAWSCARRRLRWLPSFSHA